MDHRYTDWQALWKIIDNDDDGDDDDHDDDDDGRPELCVYII